MYKDLLSCLGNDYGEPQPALLELDVGVTTACSSLATIDDEVYEDNESFRVVLSSGSSGIAIAVSSATVFITDNDGVSIVQCILL